jgi:hypothetical protein
VSFEERQEIDSHTLEGGMTVYESKAKEKADGIAGPIIGIYTL